MKLIYIQWADATSPADETWQSKDEILDWAKNDSFWIESVGWLLEENKRYLVLASKRSTTKTGEELIQYGLPIKIPKTWIRKRKIIKL